MSTTNLINFQINTIQTAQTTDVKTAVENYFDPNNIQKSYDLPYPKLNENIGYGIREGSITLYAAATGYGKTNLLLDTAIKMMKEYKVLIISTEMSVDAMIERLLAHKCKIPYSKINKITRESKIQSNDGNQDHLFQQMLDLSKKAFEAIQKDKNCKGSLEIVEIEDIQTIYQTILEKKINGQAEIFIIDHLCGIKTGEFSAQQHWRTLADKLQNLAKDNKATIIAAHQFKMEDGKNKTPREYKTIDDLTGGKDFCYCASTVLHFFETEKQQEANEILYIQKRENEYQATIKPLKARNGRQYKGEIVTYKKAICHIDEIENN
jgi:predicted ATP-dependent serine protease